MATKSGCLGAYDEYYYHTLNVSNKDSPSVLSVAMGPGFTDGQGEVQLVGCGDWNITLCDFKARSLRGNHSHAQEFGQPRSLCCVLLMNRCSVQVPRQSMERRVEWVQETFLESKDQQGEQGQALAGCP